MRDLTYRATERELMDDPEIAPLDLKEALFDISKTNRMLGGNTITLKALKHLFKENPSKKQWTIVDVGCGDGEILRLIADYFTSQSIEINLVGIDVSTHSIAMAKEMSQPYKNIRFIEKDILTIDRESFTCDVIICTLTLHHFKDSEILIFMKQFVILAQVAVVINDLQRSKIAYKLFILFSRIFIKSHVAKNDGLVSIASGFKKHELKKVAQQLKLKHSEITWKWAFRYLWLIKTL
ncbi:methyltransferase domain-containing protein [uncultured Dokdonia sp.]|uniref:methyltransferase domain-containing protein n=1 Tax=uncultured Dokdonia sp. TaxID=575653 RepID=UPI002606CB4C|nr:methyltransferase domain-containing protein [uncultured Dokdonia sp.]